jgi:tRNA (guanine-N7-)-methyltransferase
LGRKKLLRISQNALAINVLEPQKPLYETIKGNWNQVYFRNENPLVLELACGRGEYTVGLSQVFPNKNFIGIDVKGDRLAVGSAQAIDNELVNVAFLRTNILFLEQFFAENEVSDIWITFPDPFNIKRRERRRLTYPHFLELYKRVMQPEGWLHLKTDNRVLFEFTLNELKNFGIKNLVQTYDLYNSALNNEHFGIKTRFEQIFTEKGFPVHYLRCQFS